MSIDIRNLTRRFGGFTALNDVSLTINDGELVALLGPSGSGKTTLLRLIAGLDVADAGTIELHGEDATRARPQERRVGFVFQHYALFRHMSVLDNIAFGLSVRPRATRPSPAVIREKALELLRLVQLDGYADRRPHQLSGGQRQRIALARALAVEPRVLLLDEPFGALDAQVRKDLRRWLRQLHDQVHLTSVFVTHDQEEALEVADRVVVFNQGRIEQVGTPEEVYHRPATPFVHRFLGSVNVFHGRSDGDTVRVGELPVPGNAVTRDDGTGRISVLVRPHDVQVARVADAARPIPAAVTAVAVAGPAVRLDLRRSDDGQAVEVVLSHEQYARLRVRPGEAVFIGFNRYEAYGQATAEYQI